MKRLAAQAVVCGSVEIQRASDTLRTYATAPRVFYPTIAHPGDEARVRAVDSLINLGERLAQDPAVRVALLGNMDFQNLLGSVDRQSESGGRGGRMLLGAATGAAVVALNDDDEDECSAVSEVETTRSEHETSPPSLSESDDGGAFAEGSHLERFLDALSSYPPFSWFLAGPAATGAACRGRGSHSSSCSPPRAPAVVERCRTASASPSVESIGAYAHIASTPEDFESHIRRAFAVPPAVPFEYLVLGVAALILYIATNKMRAS